jgi:hypothetical protein
MRRGVVHALAVAALAAAVAGCGGGKSSSHAATTATAHTLTSPADVAACNELEANIRGISQLVSSSVEAMTQSLHPKELARRTGNTQKNLLYAAVVLTQIQAPSSLAQAKLRLIAGLRRFAGDFGRARASVARNDIATAAGQLVDRPALAGVSSATRAIDRACGV